MQWKKCTDNIVIPIHILRLDQDDGKTILIHTTYLGENSASSTNLTPVQQPSSATVTPDPEPVQEQHLWEPEEAENVINIVPADENLDLDEKVTQIEDAINIVHNGPQPQHLLEQPHIEQQFHPACVSLSLQPTAPAACDLSSENLESCLQQPLAPQNYILQTKPGKTVSTVSSLTNPRRKYSNLKTIILKQQQKNTTRRLVDNAKEIFFLIYQRNIVANVATKLEFFLVANLQVLVALATVSVAISSPVIYLIRSSRKDNFP